MDPTETLALMIARMLRPSAGIPLAEGSRILRGWTGHAPNITEAWRRAYWSAPANIVGWDGSRITLTITSTLRRYVPARHRKGWP